MSCFVSKSWPVFCFFTFGSLEVIFSRDFHFMTVLSIFVKNQRFVENKAWNGKRQVLQSMVNFAEINEVVSTSVL